MIVFLSDLHLTDGTFDTDDDPASPVHVSHDIARHAFEIFWDDIEQIVEDRKKENVHVKNITVVLLGDIFELRSTTQWVASDFLPGPVRELHDRPWKESGTRPSATCTAILDKILRNNGNLDFLTTKRLSRIPAESGLQKLVKGGVTVSFQYVHGNHDRLVTFDSDGVLKDRIARELGWTVVPRLGTLLPEGAKYVNDSLGIAAEHGHRGDFVDYYENDLKPPIGALLADTLGGLMYHIKRLPNLPDASRRALVVLCMNVDNVRPGSDRFEWLIRNVPQDAVTRDAFREAVTRTLDELVVDAKPIFDFLWPRIKDRLGDLPLLGKLWLGLVSVFKSKEDYLRDTLITELQKVLARLRKSEAEDPLAKILRDTVDAVGKLFPGEKEDEASLYHNNAHQEVCGSTARYVVDGHSHNFEVSPLETCQKGDTLKNTFYFNSGTWKRTIQKNLYPPQAGTFQRWARLTYINFYDVAAGENANHIFDLWHGNLQSQEDL